MQTSTLSKEQLRLQEHKTHKKDWRKWGPYVSDRQWGTVREDYSKDGNAWDYFPHDHARSRAYRWGEDGIAGICNDHQELCFALTLWNGQDGILKERFFGLNNHEGNHGEDVKELYYYLDNLPSHAYMKMLYKYPQAAFPYEELLKKNHERPKTEGEYELLDTGIFEGNKYFDVVIEYAKVDAEDILVRITAFNRSIDEARIVLMPTLWFRNRWDFGLAFEKPRIALKRDVSCVEASHSRLGTYYLYFQDTPLSLFTENETNYERLFGSPNKGPLVKDSFHSAVTSGNFDLFKGVEQGTKFSPVYDVTLQGQGVHSVVLRFSQQPQDRPFQEVDKVFDERIAQADEFYSQVYGENKSSDLQAIQRQALAGMLWSKQYYNLDMTQWLKGDKGQPLPPESRKQGRNNNWAHLNNADIISMPDKWEYPWYATWDLAFQCVVLALVDVEFAKEQLLLILKEWYMHPNGQLPAYEWGFGDVNPPVHARAALKIFYLEKKRTGKGDIAFLKRVFQKLLVNFTWWVDRKDTTGKNIFEGGFLGLDNIGVFDRSHGIPEQGTLAQADSTCWMGMYSLDMLDMAIEISLVDHTFEDMCTKFFEHYIFIAQALNTSGPKGHGLWNEEDGIFYDHLLLGKDSLYEIRVKSLVGLVSVFAMLYIEKKELEMLPKLRKSMQWFLNYRKENEQYNVIDTVEGDSHLLLSVVKKERWMKMLSLMLDEQEFLSPSGIRSVSKYHASHHYSLNIDGNEYGLIYDPGESSTGLFGGNSNWRGPVWFPMNYLLLDSLDRYAMYYGDEVKLEFPGGSGQHHTLKEIYRELSHRLIGIFTKDESGRRKVHGELSSYQSDPYFKDLILFYEYYHGETGKGLGASHQTGWSGLVAVLIDTLYSHPMKQDEKGMGTLKQ